MKNLVGQKSGFTFLEISIVIAILAILVSIAVPMYDGINGYAEDSELKADIASLSSAFSLSSVVNSSTGKSPIAPGTTIDALSNVEGDAVDPNTLKLYSIGTTIADYYNRLNRDTIDYLVDSRNNVYYKGKFSSVTGAISAVLEQDIGGTFTTKTADGFAGNVDTISPRDGHTAVLYNGKMIVFGGEDGSGLLGDCYEVDLSTYTSTKKALTGSTISPRFEHSAVVYNDKMIIFGGSDAGGERNDCYEVDLKTYNVTAKPLTGDPISSMRGHRAIVYNGKMIVFGGRNGASYYNDCYEIDLSTYKVTKCTLTGDGITGRYLHSAVSYNGNMIIYGGTDAAADLGDCYSINLSTYAVTARTITGDAIGVESGHTGVVCNGKMIIGHASSYYSVDLSTYAAASKSLTSPPTGRWEHSSIMYNNKLVIFGGWDTTFENDCYEMQ